jgi:hypothetical protein
MARSAVSLTAAGISLQKFREERQGCDGIAIDLPDRLSGGSHHEIHSILQQFLQGRSGCDGIGVEMGQDSAGFKSHGPAIRCKQWLHQRNDSRSGLHQAQRCFTANIRPRLLERSDEGLQQDCGGSIRSIDGRDQAAGGCHGDCRIGGVHENANAGHLFRGHVSDLPQCIQC